MSKNVSWSKLYFSAPFSSSLFAMLIGLLSNAAYSIDKKQFSSLSEYKSHINKSSIFKEAHEDLNDDGKKDYLLYSNQGEETYLEILLKNNEGYLAFSIPVGEEYEVFGSEAGTEVRVATGTFPTYGSIQGPDIHYWYDFYLITGQSVRLSNNSHVDFYKQQKVKYQSRIDDIEYNIPIMIEQLKKEDMEENFIDLQVKWKKQTISVYEKFIQNAEKIIRGFD